MSGLGGSEIQVSSKSHSETVQSNTEHPRARSFPRMQLKADPSALQTLRLGDPDP